MKPFKKRAYPPGRSAGFRYIIHNMTWKEFLQHNADKVLLLFLLHALMALMVTALATNPTLADWLKGEASTVMGALIMLITGRATRPEPTITAQTTTTQSVTVPDPKAAPVPEA